jgi:hypothetical protein
MSLASVHTVATEAAKCKQEQILSDLREEKSPTDEKFKEKKSE